MKGFPKQRTPFTCTDEFLLSFVLLLL